MNLLQVANEHHMPFLLRVASSTSYYTSNSNNSSTTAKHVCIGAHATITLLLLRNPATRVGQHSQHTQQLLRCNDNNNNAHNSCSGNVLLVPSTCSWQELFLEYMPALPTLPCQTTADSSNSNTNSNAPAAASTGTTTPWIQDDGLLHSTSYCFCAPLPDLLQQQQQQQQPHEEQQQLDVNTLCNGDYLCCQLFLSDMHKEQSATVPPTLQAQTDARIDVAASTLCSNNVIAFLHEQQQQQQPRRCRVCVGDLKTLTLVVAYKASASATPTSTMPSRPSASETRLQPSAELHEQTCHTHKQRMNFQASCNGCTTLQLAWSPDENTNIIDGTKRTTTQDAEEGADHDTLPLCIHSCQVLFTKPGDFLLHAGVTLVSTHSSTPNGMERSDRQHPEAMPLVYIQPVHVFCVDKC